jgi:hypothetical protein
VLHPEPLEHLYAAVVVHQGHGNHKLTLRLLQHLPQIITQAKAVGGPIEVSGGAVQKIRLI